MKSKIFLDTDILISSLMSNKGAAHRIVFQKEFDLRSSNFSTKEFIKVAKEHNLYKNKAKNLVASLKLTPITHALVKSFQKYALDKYDAHIIAGASASHTSHLVTYNLKHYKIDLINEELGIKVISPGHFLQSLEK